MGIIMRRYFSLFFLLSIVTTTFSFATQKRAIWLTGLPCSGKTTIAREFNKRFASSVVIDGDEVRKHINSDLGFTKQDREEHLRRITEIGKVTLSSVDTVLIACVSPYQSVRDAARNAFEKEGYSFYEVFVDAPVDTCIERDVKGMYKKAIEGEIPSFTGISAPFETPTKADLVLNTKEETLSESIGKLIERVGLIDPQQPHALFIGRWSPFHRGHWEIMNTVREENPDRPLLIFVRDTGTEYWSPEFRKGMIEAGMKKMGIKATVQIIPDIDSVNWGRGVGYTPRLVDVDARVHSISGTKIREGIREGSEDWKQFVCPGVAEYILEHNVD